MTSRCAQLAARALLLAVLVLGCAGSKPRLPTHRDADGALRARAAQVLSRAIQIPTVNPPGNEARLAAYYVSLLENAGIEARLVATPGEQRAAAWGRLAGRGDKPPVVLLSHLDVVPADPAEWQRNPFGGGIHDGHVVGRGALDAKGVSVVHLFTLSELVRRGIRLDRDLLFLATPDEEVGGRAGAGYLSSERRDLLAGAGYLLTEGGSIMSGTEGRPSAWGVSVTEKSPCWVRLSSHGTSGHSSVPPERSAVDRLLDALARVRAVERPIRVTREVATQYRALAPLAEAGDRHGFRDLRRSLERDQRFRERFLANPAQLAHVQNTLAVTVLQGSPRTNVLPSQASAHLDIRLLPGERCRDFVAELHEATQNLDVGLDILLSFPARTSPTDTALYRAIERVARAKDPRARIIPRVTAGFTDAHYFRSLGLVAYGFTPRWHYRGERTGVHGADERISLANLERGVETLIQILLELDRQEP